MPSIAFLQQTTQAHYLIPVRRWFAWMPDSRTIELDPTRVVPVGKRCLSWIEKWTTDVRPSLVTESSAQALFVSKNGKRLGPNYVSNLVRRYMEKIGITQRGSCHLLRHTAATLMMENGADLRSLQMFLGHARLNTTQIYTHVSIQRLQDVHRKTHPAKPNDPSHRDETNEQKEEKKKE